MTPTQPVYRNCVTPPASSNLTQCSSIMGQRRLYARRPTTGTPMAYSQVSCDCGVLRIDMTDGLPVEIFDFTVDEDGEPEDRRDTEDDTEPKP